MVCIPSRMGRIRLSAVRLRAPTTPNGKPIPTETATATAIRATVLIALSHKSIKPMNNRAATVNSISGQRPTAKARMRPMPTTITGHGIHAQTLLNPEQDKDHCGIQSAKKPGTLYFAASAQHHLWRSREASRTVWVIVTVLPPRRFELRRWIR